MGINLKPSVWLDANIISLSEKARHQLVDVATGFLIRMPQTNAFIAPDQFQTNGFLIAFAEPYQSPCLIVAVVATGDHIHSDIKTIFQRQL